MATLQNIQTLLNEGLRFGNREMREVFRANEVLVGFEFEMHVDDVDEDSYREDFSSYAEWAREDVEDVLWHDYLSDATASEADMKDAFSTIKDALSELHWLDPIRKAREWIERNNARKEAARANDNNAHIIHSYSMIRDLQQAIDELPDENEHLFLKLYGAVKDDLETFLEIAASDSISYADDVTLIDDLMEIYTKLKDYRKEIQRVEIRVSSDNPDQGTFDFGEPDPQLRDIDDYIDDIMTSIERLESSTNYKGLEDIIDDLPEFNHFRSFIMETQHMEDEIQSRLEADYDDYLDNLDDDSDEPVARVKRLLEEEGLWDELYVDNVVGEPSVRDGAEIVTKPIPIKDVPGVLKRAFDFIRDYGSTSHETGLHVNVSIRGKDMRKAFLHPWTALKLFLLIDERFIRRGDIKDWGDRRGRRLKGIIGHTAWHQRDYVGDVMRQSNYESLLDDLHDSNANTFDKIADIFADHLKKFEKYQGINFQHFNEFHEARRRIEFRYIGGDDYEDKYDEILTHVARYGYILKAAMSPIFAHREFARKLMRLLNSLTASYTGGDHKDYMSFVRDRWYFNRQ